MLKPIVSMNQMAMNESIATTCCYAWNGISITGSATVLHGGELQASYAGYYYYPDNTGANDLVKVSSAWFNVPLAPTFENRSKVGEGKDVPYKSGGEFGEWYVNNKAITTDCGNKIIDGDSWKWVTPSSFYSFKKTGVSLTHANSTSAHYKWVSGNEWLADHDAVQYSS